MDTPIFPSSIFPFENVYEPAEDTWILIDALENDLDYLREHATIFLECGSGSGAVTISLAKAIGSNALFFTTDVNLEACRSTVKCAQYNIGPSSKVLAVNTMFIDSLVDRLAGSIDTVIFNPPYVPTEGKIPPGSSIDAAWAGGERGRMVVDKFITLYLPRVLKRPRGRAYIVAIKQNDVDEMLDVLCSHGIRGKVMKCKKAGTELLSVIRYEYMIPCENKNLQANSVMQP